MKMDTMRSPFRIARFLLTLTLLPGFVCGREARGVFRFQSCEVARQYRLTLTQSPKQQASNVIELDLPHDWGLENLTKDWLEVTGWACKGEGQCESIAGKIRNVHLHGWRSLNGISGEFAVEFRDGRKLEGAFRAKYIKPASEIVCE
jgi:hypothetical protein